MSFSCCRRFRLLWPLTESPHAQPHHDSSVLSPYWSCVWKWLLELSVIFFFFVRYIKVIYTKWKTSGSLCGRTLSRVSVCSAAQTLSSSFWKPLSRFRMLCNTSRIWGRIWTYVILRSIELLLHDAAECICALLTHPPVAFCLQSVTFPGGLFPPLRMRCV